MLMPTRAFVVVVAATSLLVLILFRTLTPAQRAAACAVKGAAMALFADCRVRR